MNHNIKTGSFRREYLNNAYLDAVEQGLEELIQEFKLNQGYFYGEWDAKYYFYNLLASKEIFKESKGKFTTKDKKKTA